MYNYYPYNYPPQYPPQQNPFHKQFEDRIKELELKYSGINQNSPYQNSAYPATGTGQGAFPSIIPVASEEDAWKYASDWTGAKQIFYDAEQGAFYVKWFDANIPATIKEVYQKIETAPVSGNEPINNPLIENFKNLSNHMENIEAQLIDIKELINYANIDEIGLEISEPENPKLKRDNVKGDGSGAVKQITRGSDGRFRSDSAE